MRVAAKKSPKRLDSNRLLNAPRRAMRVVRLRCGNWFENQAIRVFRSRSLTEQYVRSAAAAVLWSSECAARHVMNQRWLHDPFCERFLDRGRPLTRVVSLAVNDEHAAKPRRIRASDFVAQAPVRVVARIAVQVDGLLRSNLARAQSLHFSPVRDHRCGQGTLVWSGWLRGFDPRIPRRSIRIGWQR